ncbi:hypothetical protein JTE90_005390 [Oedothorax gibbosus]|uniref:Uncharacterized protein n=1 Tax=Oedothorax gibbosus TaxID=931172 RepID=A0AAV6V7A7_9ARAC|nr:hypothetical protein JTE90_005390 [Oedothorax gibbosus]
MRGWGCLAQPKVPSSHGWHVLDKRPPNGPRRAAFYSSFLMQMASLVVDPVGVSGVELRQMEDGKSPIEVFERVADGVKKFYWGEELQSSKPYTMHPSRKRP